MYAFEQFEHRCPEIVKFTSTERVICPKRKIIEKKKTKNLCKSRDPTHAYSV